MKASLLIYILSPDGESVLTSGAAYRVASVCAGQSEDCAAIWTLAVDVSFSVTELVSSEFEEVTELFILGASFCDVARHRSVKYVDNKCRGSKDIEQVEQRRIDKEREDHIKYKKPRVYPEQSFAQGVVSVSSVHKSIKLVLKLSHYYYL